MKFPLITILTLAAATLAHTEPSTFQAANSVIGQPNFTSDDEPDPPTARSLYEPEGIAIDPATGKVFVADYGNNRVLRFSSTAAYQTNAAAEAVFGQQDFVTNSDDTTETTMYNPTGLALDSGGRLYVADTENRRVLRFDNAATKATGAAADEVIGQADFDSAAAPGGVPHSQFESPVGLAIDADDRLYVSDDELDRVLIFNDAPNLSKVAMASIVLGQPNLSTFDAETDQNSFDSPWGIFVDHLGNLWVSDEGNDRVLRFDNAATLSDEADADAVFGQDNFDSTDLDATSNRLTDPYYAVLSPNGTLWISDYGNNRILGFRDAVNRGANGDTVTESPSADIVLGQPDFDSDADEGPTSRRFEGPGDISFGREDSLFLTCYDDSRVLRFSDPVVLNAPRKIKTSRPKATIKGTSSGATIVQYRIPGQEGYKRAKGSTTRWKVKAKRLTRRATKVKLRAIAFDNRQDTAKTKVIMKP